jgi:hypothetical protein
MENRKEYRILVDKLERYRTLGITVCRWDDNIKTDLSNLMVCHGLDLSALKRNQ